MAIYYSQILLYSLFIYCLLILKTEALTFNPTNIGSDQLQIFNITGFPDAYVSSQGLQLTSDASNVSQGISGKATYIDPLHLWDNSTGNLTDFYTHFTFVIDSRGATEFPDGIAFFLAPNGSNSSAGGAIGLPLIQDWSKPTSPFVVVEFDTYHNVAVDPLNISPVTHVGIDVNSVKSYVTAVWYCNITHGIENEAWIRYDSSSKNLSVVFTSSTNTIRVEDTIHLTVDLRYYLPEWVTFEFSAATRQLFETNTIKSWEFTSSLQNNDTNKNVTPPMKPIRKKLCHWVVAGLVVGSVVLVGGLFLVVFGLLKRSRAKEENKFKFDMSMENEFKYGIGPYGQLSCATNNFDEEQKLGEGRFGGVYRDFLRESNCYIAVKRLSKESKQGEKEYASEMNIISRLRHKNLVRLIGWCHEKIELLLAYEFMENGSLDSHLFKGKSLFTWEARYKIAQGLAFAFHYLHEEWDQCVVHRDIKSSNVMLDSNFNAKLGDFGFVMLVDHEKVSQTNVMEGTMGYVALERVSKVSKESDVYSFGIVALEIACGRRPTYYEGDKYETRRLVEWVWDLYGRGKLLEATDSKLGEDFNKEEMKRLLVVGLLCAHPDSKIRPSIREAIQVLNFEAPSLCLPSTMPVAMY